MSALILEIVEGEGAGKTIELSGEVELGRDPALANVLPDDQVSRRHARLTPAGGQVRVEDLGSRNGTYVNDQPVGEGVTISPGDRIRVGLTVLELRSPEQVAAQPSAVGPVPPLTQVGAEVLQPAPEQELSPVPDEPPRPPGLATDESEPAFIPSEAVDRGLGGSGEAAPPAGGDQGEDYLALPHLADTRVKRQTSIAAIALPAIAILAVVIVLGVIR